MLASISHPIEPFTTSLIYFIKSKRLLNIEVKSNTFVMNIQGTNYVHNTDSKITELNSRRLNRDTVSQPVN